MTREEKINRLSEEFKKVIREWLTTDEVAEVNLLNSGEYAVTGCCATHDFCDANMAMAEAYKQLGWEDPMEYPIAAGEREIAARECELEILDLAWTKAKGEGF